MDLHIRMIGGLEDWLLIAEGLAEPHRKRKPRWNDTDGRALQGKTMPKTS